jgi:hypothetical protein
MEWRHFSTSERTRKSSWLVWLTDAKLDRLDWLLLQKERSLLLSKLTLELVAESLVFEASSLMEEMEEMVEVAVGFRDG